MKAIFRVKYDIDHGLSETVSSSPGDDRAAEGHDQPQQREKDRNSGLQRPHGRAHEAVPVGLFQAAFLGINLNNGPLLIYLYKRPTATETHGNHIFCLKKSTNLLYGMNLVWNGPWLT